MTTISVETSRDNTTWFHYKDLSIDTMKNNNNSVAEILNVISPYMRLTVDNTDPNIARPVKLYIHGIKSRD